jgi:hypothetical protein
MHALPGSHCRLTSPTNVCTRGWLQFVGCNTAEEPVELGAATAEVLGGGAAHPTLLVVCTAADALDAELQQLHSVHKAAAAASARAGSTLLTAYASAPPHGTAQQRQLLQTGAASNQPQTCGAVCQVGPCACACSICTCGKVATRRCSSGKGKLCDGHCQKLHDLCLHYTLAPQTQVKWLEGMLAAFILAFAAVAGEGDAPCPALPCSALPCPATPAAMCPTIARLIDRRHVLPLHAGYAHALRKAQGWA